MRVLGIDPGLTRCGLGAVEVDDSRRATLVGVEVARTSPALATHFGKRVTEISVAHEERHSGKSQYPWRKLIDLQFDLVASFSDLPIKLIMYGGIAMATFGVCFGMVLAVSRLVYGAIWAAQGVFTLFAVLFVFVGLQFFALGVIGEYIGRIYREVRRRPEYVIEKIYGDHGKQTTERLKGDQR